MAASRIKKGNSTMTNQQNSFDVGEVCYSSDRTQPIHRGMRLTTKEQVRLIVAGQAADPHMKKRRPHT